jgi:hypothetical protein
LTRKNKNAIIKKEKGGENMKTCPEYDHEITDTEYDLYREIVQLNKDVGYLVGFLKGIQQKIDNFELDRLIEEVIKEYEKGE